MMDLKVEVKRAIDETLARQILNLPKDLEASFKQMVFGILGLKMDVWGRLEGIDNSTVVFKVVERICAEVITDRVKLIAKEAVRAVSLKSSEKKMMEWAESYLRQRIERDLRDDLDKVSADIVNEMKEKVLKKKDEFIRSLMPVVDIFNPKVDLSSLEEILLEQKAREMADGSI